jgi:proline dehydrogenase
VLRALFIALSESRSLRHIAERSRIGQRTSSRFVAGTQVADAIRTAAAVNQFGAGVSIDNLGENVTTAEEAQASANLYHHLLDEIAARKLEANISLKLTHMGLDVDKDLAIHLVRGLVARAAGMSPKNFVRVDMEGSAYTQLTLDFVEDLHRMPGNAGCVGAVIQSYMRRAEDDIGKLLSQGIRIRLCKGAYKEPPEKALQDMAEIRKAFLACTRMLLDGGTAPAVATHDEVLIGEAMAYAKAQGIPASRFEFQMLYGLRQGRWGELVRDGYRVRIYVPFGTHWIPYFYRRLRERRENVLFVLRNLFR